jgi:hypothetical protein
MNEEECGAACSRAATVVPSLRPQSGRSWRDDGNQAEAAAVPEAAATTGGAAAPATGPPKAARLMLDAGDRVGAL